MDDRLEELLVALVPLLVAIAEHAVRGEDALDERYRTARGVEQPAVEPFDEPLRFGNDGGQGHELRGDTAGPGTLERRQNELHDDSARGGRR